MRTILLAMMLVVGPVAPAKAQSVTEAILAKTRDINVQLALAVRDDCLPNPDTIKNAVELKLIANGIKVIDKSDTLGPAILGVVLTGFASKSKGGMKTGCAAHIRMSLSAAVAAYVPFSTTKESKAELSITYVEAWENGSLLLGSEPEFQPRLKSTIENFTDEVILKILKTRQEVFAKYPHFKENFERASKK